MKGERAGKFWFSNGMPDEVKDIIKPLLLESEYLIPNWCNEVAVYWDAEGETNTESANLVAAYIETNYAYRFASLFICPAFLSEEKEERGSRIKHELCHIVSAPLVYYVRAVVGIIDEQDKMSELVQRESAERCESMTEDLTQIILKAEQFLSKK